MLAKSSEDLENLKTSGGEAYDSVLFRHTTCYSYKVTHPDKDFRVGIYTYSGDPDIYVNPENYQIPLRNFKWNSRDHFENEELVLEPKLRKEKNAAKGMFYICVFGNTASTYKIWAKNEDHSIFLKSGLSESGYMKENQMKLYYYRDPVMLKDIEVKFFLHVMLGKARLRAKLCSVKPNDKKDHYLKTCFYTLDEMQAYDPNEKIEYDIGSESATPDLEVCTNFTTNKNGVIQRKNQPTCSYAVGLLGMARYETHYSVLVKPLYGISYSFLTEGHPFHTQIKELEKVYFRFEVLEPTTTRVMIQLTTIHGDPDLYVTVNKTDPDVRKFDHRSSRCGIYPDIIDLRTDTTKKSLVGQYYIMITGYMQSTFTIAYFTEHAHKEKGEVRLF